MRNPVSLPIVVRDYLDNSIGNTLDRCARLTFINYVLNRSAEGSSPSLNFGNAYHKFREVLEVVYKKSVVVGGKDLEKVSGVLFELASKRALDGWQDPPLEHRYSYLDAGRAITSYEAAFSSWLEEKRNGVFNVLHTESPFLLPLPGWWRCEDWVECDYKVYEEQDIGLACCPKCGGKLARRHFAGKIDQVLEWNGRLWFRDFKTTSRKDNFKEKFNPDHQFTGYTWAAQHLSGRRLDGGIIDVIYNTKTKGPEFYPTYANRASGDIAHWLEWIHERFSEYEERIRSGSWTMKTSSCGDFSGCFFRPACNSGDWNAVELFLEQKTIYSEWDPLDPEKEVGLPE